MAYAGFKVIKIDGVYYREYPSGTIKHIPPIKAKFNMYKTEQCIYLVTDMTTGKLYVGSTKNMRNRMRSYQSRDLTKRVFRGLALNNLKIQPIEYCPELTKEQRLYKEYEYILKYNTIYPNGNNMQCPIRNIKFSLLDMTTYNPLTHVYEKKSNSYYNKERYERNKERISAQRKARYKAKQLNNL